MITKSRLKNTGETGRKGGGAELTARVKASKPETKRHTVEKGEKKISLFEKIYDQQGDHGKKKRGRPFGKIERVVKVVYEGSGGQTQREAKRVASKKKK